MHNFTNNPSNNSSNGTYTFSRISHPYLTMPTQVRPPPSHVRLVPKYHYLPSGARYLVTTTYSHEVQPSPLRGGVNCVSGSNHATGFYCLTGPNNY